MAIAAAREIKDGDIVFCGTGISLLAAMAAKHIHAPQSVIFFETGAVDPELLEIPMTVADSRLMYGACQHTGLAEAFAFMQNRFLGPKVLGILGAAQIDCYGNLNSTCLGNYHRPSLRFPGSGGASDVGSFVGGFIVFIRHELRRFVKKLDYFTTPGYFDGPGGRERQGYDHGGPICVISDMGIMRFGKNTKKLYLDRYFPEMSPHEIQKCTGFPINTNKAKKIITPTDDELEILRCQVDPQRLILGKADYKYKM